MYTPPLPPLKGPYAIWTLTHGVYKVKILKQNGIIRGKSTNKLANNFATALWLNFSMTFHDLDNI